MNKEGKENKASKIESLQRIVKEHTNRVIELKRTNGGSSIKTFKQWKKKINNPKHLEVEGMNFEKKTMDGWCHAHNDYNLEKTCREFINMYNILLVFTT